LAWISCASALLVLWTALQVPVSSTSNFRACQRARGSSADAKTRALLHLALRGGTYTGSSGGNSPNASGAKGSSNVPDSLHAETASSYGGSGRSWAERVKYGAEGAVGDTGDGIARAVSAEGQRRERAESSATRARSLSPSRHGHSPERPMDSITSRMAQMDLKDRPQDLNGSPAIRQVGSTKSLMLTVASTASMASALWHVGG
jgi:hypothetical protein